jgi:hypothetical protein
MSVEFDKRLAQVELSLSAIKATGTDANAINQQSVETARLLIGDLGERQGTLQAMIDHVQVTAAQAAEHVARVDEQVSRLEKTSAQALGEAQSAAVKAAAALEKAAQPASAAVALVVSPEEQGQASASFQTFLEHCQKDHMAAVDRHNQLQAQTRAALRDLPSLSEGAVQKFSEQAGKRLEQLWSNWLQPREHRVAEMDSRFDEIMERAAGLQEALEHALGQQKPDTEPPEWAESLRAATMGYGSELKFLKTMVWITLAAVALSYGLVIYAVILRSPTS